jgi:hypothetical protein
VPDIAALDGHNVRAVQVTIDSAALEASVHDPVTQLVQHQYIVRSCATCNAAEYG